MSVHETARAGRAHAGPAFAGSLKALSLGRRAADDLPPGGHGPAVAPDRILLLVVADDKIELAAVRRATLGCRIVHITFPTLGGLPYTAFAAGTNGADTDHPTLI